MEEKLIKSIIKIAENQAPSSDKLWSVDDIAAYLNMASASVYAALPRWKKAGFPRAIQVPNKDGNPSHKRWVAKEVQSWAERQREVA